MPPIHGPYPYNLTWEELVPEPRPGQPTPKEVVEALHWCVDTGSDSVDLERIFGAALALAGRMLTMPEWSKFSRGEILTIAIDTAIVWERG